MLARIAHDLYWLGRHLVARRAHRAACSTASSTPTSRGGRTTPPRSRSRGTRCSRSWAPSATADGPARATTSSACSRSTPTNPVSIVSCVDRRARGRAHAARHDLGRDVGVGQHLRPAAARRDLDAACAPGRTRSTPTSRSAARCSGASPRARCRRTTRAPSWSRAAAIEAADMVLRMLRVALPPAPADGDGPRRPGATATRSPCCRAVGGFQAFMRAAAAPPNAEPGRRASCSTSASSRTRWRRRSSRSHAALERVEAEPQESRAGAARPPACLPTSTSGHGCRPARTPSRRRSGRSSRSSSALDGEIDERFFHPSSVSNSDSHRDEDSRSATRPSTATAGRSSTSTTRCG